MRALPRTVLYAVLPMVLVLAAACGDQQGSVDDPGTRDSRGVDLVGTWVVTEINEGELEREPVEGTEIRIEFTEDRIVIQAGCNRLGGDWTLEGDQLTVGSMEQTEMGCDQERMEQDTWLAEFFASPATVGTDPLTFTAGDAVLTLAGREDVHPDQSLTGTTWHLDTIVEGELASSVPEGVEAQVIFDDEGNVETHDGCNGGGGKAMVEGAEITFSDMFSTLMACMDARGDVSEVFRSVLEGTVTWSITENRLELAKGETKLGFNAG